MFYACGGSADTYHLSLNSFTAFLDDCKVSSWLGIASAQALSALPADACLKLDLASPTVRVI